MIQKENILKQIYSDIETCMNLNNIKKISDNSIYFRKGYEPYKLSKDNFFVLSKRVSDKKTAFIDGGNSLLIDTPSIALGFIRIAAVIVKQNKSIKIVKKEFFVLAKTVVLIEDYSDNLNNLELAKGSNSSKIIYEVIIYPANPGIETKTIISDFKINPEELGLVKSDDEFKPSNAIGLARRISEIKLAEELIKELDSGDMVVLDGSLRTFVNFEDFALASLYNSAMKKNVLVCAISKTCSIITDSGDSLINAVSLIADKDKIWYYHPIAESVSVLHKAELFLVKLNRSSEYIFILEIYKDQAKSTDYPKIIGFFAYMSRDLAFPGYPYWLIKADQIARVANEENEMLTTRFFAMNKDARKMLFSLIRSVDAHSILDNIR